MSSVLLLRLWLSLLPLLLLACCPLSGQSASSSATLPSSPLGQLLDASLAASENQGTTMALACQDGAMVLLFRSPCASSEADREGRRHDDDDDNNHSKAASGKETLLGLRLTDPVYRSYYDSSLRAAAATTASASHASSIKWTLLQNGAALSSAPMPLVCCTMTGFAPDVDYITGVLLQLVENHHTLYSSSSGSGSGSTSSQVDVDSGSASSSTMQRWIQVISDFLREPGQFQGGRPYGIQALLIGRRHHLATKRRTGANGGGDTDTASNSALGVGSLLKNRHPLRVVTFDPSGGYRDWPLGVTAIGRWAKEVRRQLVQTCIDTTTATVSNGAATTTRPAGPVKAASASALEATARVALVDWQRRTGAQALRWGLQASMAVVTANTETESHDEHYYQAWLLWPHNDADCDNYCMAQVDGRQVKELQESILAERQQATTQ